jgi:myo-inositol 2-dehydrogenase / D-chiro-inositol 1-dehydrogenase
MNIGLIGFGAWGRRHAQAIANLSGVQLTAIAVSGPESAAAARSAVPNAVVTTDYRELLHHDDIDMLDIVVPNILHAQIAEAGLHAGKHVLVEKPMAISLEECDRLVAAEKATGKRVSVGHELRVSSQWARVKKEIDAGRIGAPNFVNITLFRNSYRPGANAWRYDRSRVGSWILEETVHFYDLALWYLAARGDPISLRAMGTTRDDHPGMFETLSTTLRFTGGAMATINHCTAGFGHHLTVEVAGGEGAIRTHWRGTMDRDESARFDFRIRPRGFAFERGVSEFEEIPLEASGETVELEHQIALTADAFARAEALVSAAEARKSVIICLAAEEAAQTGAEIPLAF